MLDFEKFFPSFFLLPAIKQEKNLATKFFGKNKNLLLFSLLLQLLRNTMKGKATTMRK